MKFSAATVHSSPSSAPRTDLSSSHFNVNIAICQWHRPSSPSSTRSSLPSPPTMRSPPTSIRTLVHLDALVPCQLLHLHLLHPLPSMEHPAEQIKLSRRHLDCETRPRLWPHYPAAQICVWPHDFSSSSSSSSDKALSVFSFATDLPSSLVVGHIPQDKPASSPPSVEELRQCPWSVALTATSTNHRGLQLLAATLTCKQKKKKGWRVFK